MESPARLRRYIRSENTSSRPEYPPVDRFACETIRPALSRTFSKLFILLDLVISKIATLLIYMDVRDGTKLNSCAVQSMNNSYLTASHLAMPATIEKRTISLSKEQAAYIDAKVEKGDYASVSEVVRAGLRALRERDAAIEQWLHTEVASAYDAMKANPDRAVPLDSAVAKLRDRHSARMKQGKA